MQYFHASHNWTLVHLSDHLQAWDARYVGLWQHSFTVFSRDSMAVLSIKRSLMCCRSVCPFLLCVHSTVFRLKSTRVELNIVFSVWVPLFVSLLLVMFPSSSMWLLHLFCNYFLISFEQLYKSWRLIRRYTIKPMNDSFFLVWLLYDYLLFSFSSRSVVYVYIWRVWWLSWVYTARSSSLWWWCSANHKRNMYVSHSFKSKGIKKGNTKAVSE